MSLRFFCATFLNDSTFAVTKRLTFENGKCDQRYYAATRQIPAIAEIKRLRNTTEKRNAWNALVDEQKLPDIGPRSVRGDDPDALMTDYEQKHPELAEWVHQEVQFFGPPNIGGGKLDHYTKFVYVPAVRDASDDLKDSKGSPLFQLLDFIVMRRFRARADVRVLQDEFSGRLKELYAPSKLSEFNELATDISNTLHLYVPNAQFDLRVSEPSLPEIPSPAAIAELIEDEYQGSIDRKGHGLQRALIFSLLQHLAVAQPVEATAQSQEEVQLDEKPRENLELNESSLPIPVGSVGPDLIIAIEEPELYQHPLRARHLARILLNMSRESNLGPGGRNQIAYTTHSPYFVDLERFDQLRIMRKYRRDLADPPCANVASFSLQNAALKLAELTGNPPEDFTATSFRARAYPVMTQTVNEGFFADAVVLVEGDTEAAALLAVADVLKKDWMSQGVAIVPVGGKTKIDRAAVVFKGLGIPTYVVFDGDGGHRGTPNEQKEASANRLLLKLSEATEKDFPTDCAETQYACFEHDFETYCKDEIGSTDYETLRQEAARAHGYSRPSDGVKNFDVVAELVNLIYGEGHQLHLLERIVEQVDQMLLHPLPAKAQRPLNA